MMLILEINGIPTNRIQAAVNDKYLAQISCFANTHRETFYVIKMLVRVNIYKKWPFSSVEKNDPPI